MPCLNSRFHRAASFVNMDKIVPVVSVSACDKDHAHQTKHPRVAGKGSAVRNGKMELPKSPVSSGLQGRALFVALIVENGGRTL